VTPAAPRFFPAGLPGTQAVTSLSRGFMSYRVCSLWRGKVGLSPGTSLLAGLSNRALPVSTSRDHSQTPSGVCGGHLQCPSTHQFRPV